MMTSNEHLHTDIDGIKRQIEELLVVVLKVEDHDKRLKLIEDWRNEAEAFQAESRHDRQQLRELVDGVPERIQELVKTELYSKSYRNQRQQETEQALATALRKVFNIKSVAGFFGMLVTIIVFAERVYAWVM